MPGNLRLLAETTAARAVSAFQTFPGLHSWLRVAQVVAATGAVALPIGLRTNFLRFRPVTDFRTVLLGSASAAVAPALTEEVLFRAALLPHPAVDGTLTPATLVSRSLLPLTGFVLYHLINPSERAKRVFWDARFLGLAAVLGTGCTASYFLTGGSLWAAAATHWLPVVVWLYALGGAEKLQP